jgi:aminoglycoside 3-N-acetyltransferase
MLVTIDRILRKISPALHAFLKSNFRKVRKKINPKLSKDEFRDLLETKLKLRKGDVVFVHSSMRNLYLKFSKQEILSVLLEIVGEEGTVMFPCWQFNVRAEDYLRDHDIVFDINQSPSAVGRIPEDLRHDPLAVRSFHPTNSIVAKGKYAALLMAGHEDGIYPCGSQSPWGKMLAFDAKVIGIGVSVNSLTFVHAVEDEMKDDFPIKARKDEVYTCKCIDRQGEIRLIRTLVASTAIGHRDVYGFFRKYISRDVYRDVPVKGMHFFSFDAVPVFDALKDLARKNQTIYKFT